MGRLSIVQRTQLVRGDGNVLLLDASEVTSAPTTPVDAEAYAKTGGHRWLTVRMRNAAGAGTATVKIWYAPDDSPTAATDWVQDLDVGTSGNISLSTASLEERIELAGYPWVYVQVAAVGGGGTVTVDAWGSSPELEG
jgi:hypothetical protein